MNELKESTFVIIRDDLGVDAKKLISKALTIGSAPDCHVWLNHANVSPLHVGINQADKTFYLANLSPSNPTLLNGEAVAARDLEPLIEGDEAQIGPFFLSIAEIEPETSTIIIAVRLQLALSVGVRKPVHKIETYERQRAQKRITASLEAPPNSLRVFWEKRIGGKASKRSPLHPRTVRSGRARYNWLPTRDLIRPWPFAIPILAAMAIAMLSGLAAFAHKIAFAPDVISNSHARNMSTLTPPAIAKEPSGSACFSCHVIGVGITNSAKMSAKCQACHQAEGFAASIIPAHREAGITCTTCHGEHRGEDFRPIKEALELCAKCHNDDNKKTYKGKSIHTPHGGTYGYPVVNSVWIWKGLDAEELSQKSDVLAELVKSRVDSNNAQQWRNAQFHAIHVYRVRVVPGIEGIIDNEFNQVLECRSCHGPRYMGANVDRILPRTTCRHCHSTQTSNEAVFRPGVDVPSCTSCHVQHVKDTHWTSNLLIVRPVTRPETEKERVR
jgi:predicted CXXCH cytochrome family protein